MKPNMMSVPADTFLAKDTHDPLRHTTHDLFWYHIEPHFNPITTDDLQGLHRAQTEFSATPTGISSETNTGADLQDALISSLQCYPLAQRLTAALLDEGKGNACAAKAVRAGLAAEGTWLGGTTDAVRHFSAVMDDRIRVELQEYGLLDKEQTSDLSSTFRLDHWHLNNVASINNGVKGGISKKVTAELNAQSARRQQKIRDDQIEIKYLETMMEKGGKRGKGRFNKLLNQMHPNRNLHPGELINGLQKSGSGAVGENGISKKRKRKSSAGDRITHASSDGNALASVDAADNLAPHIADIIWKHNNQAPLEEIVKEFLKRVPQLAGDMKEAKRRITNCMSFSRKPYRFRKMPDGVTYSATKV